MSDSKTSETVLRLVVEYQDRLYRYIYSLCPIEHEARDILQETCVALIREADAYDCQRPFLAWAYRFSQLEVLKRRDRIARSRRVFEPDVIELLSRQRQLVDDALQAELDRLAECMKLLDQRDRNMIEARYHGEESIEVVARNFGVSRSTFFRDLQRIRRQLMHCIVQRSQEAIA